MSTPTLSDERIDAMRSSVMQVVDEDVARRGRRFRRTIGVAAASVLVIGTGALGVRLIDGAASSSSDSASAGKSSLPSGASALDEGSDSAATTEQRGGIDEDRQVVTTGEIAMTVPKPRAVAQQIATYAERIGGRVDTRSEDGVGDGASAHVTIRVPSTQVTATIDRLGTYGTVKTVSLHNDDVTAQAKDLDARIDALRLSISRLEKILADADTSAELIKAETSLTQRQEQLESLQAQRKGLADQVSLSTLSIDIAQTARAESVEPGGFTGGLRDGWNGLVSTVNRVVEVAGVLLPWAVVVALLVGAQRLLTRRRGRDRTR